MLTSIKVSDEMWLNPDYKPVQPFPRSYYCKRIIWVTLILAVVIGGAIAAGILLFNFYNNNTNSSSSLSNTSTGPIDLGLQAASIQISLVGNYYTININSFASQFAISAALVLSIPISQIVVYSITPGSIIVKFEILPPPPSVQATLVDDPSRLASLFVSSLVSQNYGNNASASLFSQYPINATVPYVIASDSVSPCANSSTSNTTLLCQTPDPCTSNPCQNSGRCNSTGNQYSCSCPANYVGNQCQFVGCLGNQCVKGSCVPDVGNYTCDCYAGYQDRYCDALINNCHTSLCSPNSTCTNFIGNNTYECNCDPGYNGTYCDGEINNCVGIQCDDGATCVSIPGDQTYYCSCPDGYFGISCQYAFDYCVVGHCPDHSTCVSITGVGYDCVCNTGYQGTNCTDSCQLNSTTCMYGGICFPELICSNACQDNSGICENGGSCFYQPSDPYYNCSCIHGFSGYNCTQSICQANPGICQQNQDCSTQSTYPYYSCACASPWVNYPSCNAASLSTPNIQTLLTMPSNYSIMYVKLWGAGGGSATDAANFAGGAGGFLYFAINITTGYVFGITVGQAGQTDSNTNGPSCVSSGGGSYSNGAGGSAVITLGDQFCGINGGGGGQYSAIHQVIAVNGTYLWTLIAAAGGGGGGGANGNGQTAIYPGSGISYMNPYTGNTLLPGGDGGNGQNPSGVNAGGGAGGGGYGGGNGDTTNEGSGNGGGSYLIAKAYDFIINMGSGNTPGGTSDPNYANQAGYGGTGGLGTSSGNNGYVYLWLSDLICETNPGICQNGASCSPSAAAPYYQCNCVPGTFGNNCTGIIDYCASPSNPCQNNATCTSSIGNYQCNCQFGWLGKNCTQNICQRDTGICQNNANCSYQSDSPYYNCKCPSGTSGYNCSTTLCNSNPGICKNGGMCSYQNAAPYYNCGCSGGYFGTNCTNSMCSSPGQNLCANNASCGVIATSPFYQCSCTSQYTGYNCTACNYPYVNYPSCNIISSTATNTQTLFTIPTKISYMQVRLWGAGGGGSEYPNAAGGGGAFILFNYSVTHGSTYGITVGQGGTTTGNAGCFSSGGGSYSNGAGGASVVIGGSDGDCFTGGGGGQYSALHLVNSTGTFIWTLIGAAGGGGGGGSGQSGGTIIGGNSIYPGSGSGYTNPFVGNTLIPGGDGTEGTNHGNAGLIASGGGGGGGFGGGTGSTDTFGHAGAGGGSYVISSAYGITTDMGSGITPGGLSDSQYINVVGYGGSTQNGGNDGYVYIIFA